MATGAVAWCTDVAGVRSHRSLDGASPLSIFEPVEAPSLLALPRQVFELASWSAPKVGHTIYSVPWRLIGQRLDAREGDARVEFFADGLVVKTWPRAERGRRTDNADYPPDKIAFFMRTPLWCRWRAAELGPAVSELVRIGDEEARTKLSYPPHKVTTETWVRRFYAKSGTQPFRWSGASSTVVRSWTKGSRAGRVTPTQSEAGLRSGDVFMARVVRTLGFVSLLILPMVVLQPASADPVDLTCPFSATIHFSPGLTLISRPVEISGSASAGTSVTSIAPCSSLTGVPYTGASGPVSGSGSLACVTADLSGGASGTLPITWDNGDTSTITWSATVSGAVPTVSAQVTSGSLTGSSIVVAPVPTGFNGNCLVPLTSVSFTGVLTFLGT